MNSCQIIRRTLTNKITYKTWLENPRRVGGEREPGVRKTKHAILALYSRTQRQRQLCCIRRVDLKSPTSLWDFYPFPERVLFSISESFIHGLLTIEDTLIRLPGPVNFHRKVEIFEPTVVLSSPCEARIRGPHQSSRKATERSCGQGDGWIRR